MMRTHISSSTVALAIIAGPTLVSLALLGLLSVGVNNPIVLYIALLSAWPFLIVFMPFVLKSPRIRVGRYDQLMQFVVTSSFLAVLYFVAWIPAGLFAGQHIKDVIGSTLRAVTPFLTFLVAAWALGRLRGTNDGQVIDQACRYLIIVAALGAVAKLSLVATGNWDAWGLGGYAGPTFVVILLLLTSLNSNWPIKRRLICVAIVGLIIIATVLSLKRNAWVILILTPLTLFAFSTLRFKIRVAIASILAVSALAFVLQQLALYDLLVDRIQYTFDPSTDSGLDNSSAGRLNETVSAVGTLSSRGFPLSIFVGLGPGAGYENLTGWPFKNFNELGEPYDLHSGYVLILFRYGLFGGVFHLVVFAIAFILVLGAVMRRDLLSRNFGRDFSFFRVAPMASGLHLLLIIPAMFASPGLFADSLAGAVLAIGLVSRQMLANNRGET